MEIEWDESKRLSNLQKHRIDFIGAEKLFDGYTITFEVRENTMVSNGLLLLVGFKVL